MALGAILEENRRNVFRECDVLRRRLRVFCPARVQREEPNRRAENCDNNNDACFFHFYSTALCFENQSGTATARVSKRLSLPTAACLRARYCTSVSGEG